MGPVRAHAQNQMDKVLHPTSSALQMEAFTDAQMWGFSERERQGETQSKLKYFYGLHSGGMDWSKSTPYIASACTTAMLCVSQHTQHCLHALWVRSAIAMLCGSEE